MRRVVLAGVALATLSAGSAGAATYSVYDQFAISGGAITAANFAFGYGPSSYAGSDTISGFPDLQQVCDGDANVQCARVGSLPGIFKANGAYDVTGTAFYDAGELNLHPGPSGETAIVQFIAPIAGLYSFAGAFSYNDVFPTGVDVAAYVAGVSQIANSVGAFNFVTTLAAGQKVNFAVGAAGNYGFDSTGFAVTATGPDRTGGVPEPAAWALMILGFGGAGAALRRRRTAPI